MTSKISETSDTDLSETSSMAGIRIDASGQASLVASNKNKKIHSVTKVKDVKGFKMLVEFDGADVRAIDLTKLVQGRPSFRRLKDPKTFARFEINNGDLKWSRDLEITGPTLYHMGDDSDLAALP